MRFSCVCIGLLGALCYKRRCSKTQKWLLGLGLSAVLVVIGSALAFGLLVPLLVGYVDVFVDNEW